MPAPKITTSELITASVSFLGSVKRRWQAVNWSSTVRLVSLPSEAYYWTIGAERSKPSSISSDSAAILPSSKSN